MRFVWLIAVFCLSSLSVCCGNDPAPSPAPASAAPSAPDTGPAGQQKETGIQVECPVCGLQFDSSEARHVVEHEKKRYFFLLEDHMKALLADPDRYIERTDAPQ